MFSGSFIGRCGKNAEIVQGAHGEFVSLNVAESYYYKGENKTRWYSVKISTPRALKMAQYWTKGRQLEIVGELVGEPYIYEDTEGRKQCQFKVNAFRIEFVSSGKRQEIKNGEGVADNKIAPVSDADIKATPDLPFEAAATNGDDDLPF